LLARSDYSGRPSVQLIIHVEDWKPLVLTLDATEVDELVDKVLDARRQLAMQNE
jgi:hypothetical protein